MALKSIISIIAASLLFGSTAVVAVQLEAINERTVHEALALHMSGAISDTISAAKAHAERGDILAQYLLGSAFANSRDVKNFAAAEKWLRLCADKGLVPAMRDLGHLNLLYKGDGSKWDEALSWYKLAATRGDHESQQVLGILNAKVINDPAQAYVWLTLSEATSDEEARNLSKTILNELRKSMSAAALKEGEILASQKKAATVVITKSELGDLRSRPVIDKYMASNPQLRFGSFSGDLLGLNLVFGALLYPAGGLIGKGSY